MFTDRTGGWLELSVEADLEAVEAVSEVLTRYGYQGGVVIEEAQRPADDGISLQRDPTRPAWVRAYIPQDETSPGIVRQVELALGLLGELRPIGPLQVRALSEKDWAEAWKENYTVLHVSERIVIVPAWRRFRARRGQVAIHMDPGMAFGTGLHPTTQLCLQALERLLQPGARVLDLGTGSGILAIAAARLGSGPILALDRDPLAVEAARHNVRRNRQRRRIEVRQGTISADIGPFDLILANLLTPVLREIAVSLAQALAQQGLLLSSGILVEQAELVAAAYAAAGLQIVERLEQGDWTALIARR